MPTLHRSLEESFAAIYADAVSGAADETGLQKTCFPETCPFHIEQVLDQQFFPAI